MIFTILLPQIVIVKLRANKSKFENRLELFNEWFCANSTILFCLFTDHYATDLQNQAGWVVDEITVLGILINLIILIYFQGYKVRLLIKKWQTHKHHDYSMEKTPEWLKIAIEEFRQPEQRAKLDEYIN